MSSWQSLEPPQAIVLLRTHCECLGRNKKQTSNITVDTHQNCLHEVDTHSAYINFTNTPTIFDVHREWIHFQE